MWRVAAGGVFRGEAVSCRCVFLSCDSSSDELMCLHWQPAIVTVDIYVMYIYLANKLCLSPAVHGFRLYCRYSAAVVGGSVAEWLACWTQAQMGPGSNRSRDAVG